MNLSGDKEQEYFSGGLTEELLNSLAEIDALQVATRTSPKTIAKLSSFLACKYSRRLRQETVGVGCEILLHQRKKHLTPARRIAAYQYARGARSAALR